MPYNPGISYNQGAPIGQGISTAIGRWLEFAGMLKNEADQTKSLRTTLTELEPAKKDQFSQMTRAELQGYAGATAMKTTQAQSALKMMLDQQKLKNEQTIGAGNDAMANALKQTSEPGGPNLMAPGQPGAPSDTATGGDATALFRAMQANPQSANTPAGQAVLRQYLRTGAENGGGAGDVVPWQVGGMSGVMERRSNKIVLDPETESKIAAAKRKPTETGTGTPPNPEGPVLSKDGNFYWDSNVETWKPMGARAGAAKGKLNLFDEADAQGANAYKNQADVVSAYKAGKLSYAEAAKMLRETFGVK